MAGEPAGADTVREPETTATVSRLRGLVFEGLSAAATIFGITVVSGLLLYVANDALRPFSADLGWLLVFFASLGLPTLSVIGYYLFKDRSAGQVAFESLGIITVGAVLAGGFVILFHELVTPIGWLSLIVALGISAGAIRVHGRIRQEAAIERLAVSVLTPIIGVFGIPGMSVRHTVALPLSGTELFDISFTVPQLLPSVRDLVVMIPFLPVDWLILILTVTVPVSFVFGRYVASKRNDGRGQYELVGGAVAIAVFIALVVQTVGYSPENGVLITTAVLVPSATYLEGVIRRRKGWFGLLFPVVILVGGLIAIAITGTLGFNGPDPWLDWSFLTNAHSRTPEDAGIYPALVGSVLIVLVIALMAFPVGVGAAIYLEEYAPNSGWLARFVELVEINIGNLAGVPSIVYGLLGLALFIQGIGLRSGIVIVGGLTVGLLILPIVIISAQEAVRAVPDSRRQASYGMGATRWQTIRNVVLPEALPGILTGTILALGRAIGETAPLLMIGIASSVRSPPSGFFSKTGAMPRQIFSWSSEIQPEFRFGVLAAGVIVLVTVLLVMNGTAIVLRNRYQRSD